MGVNATVAARHGGACVSSRTLRVSRSENAEQRRDTRNSRYGNAKTD